MKKARTNWIKLSEHASLVDGQLYDIKDINGVIYLRVLRKGAAFLFDDDSVIRSENVDYIRPTKYPDSRRKRGIETRILK